MATKSQIVFRKVGKNVKLVIDGETLTRKLEDAEEIKILKERVVAYNAKPLIKDKKSLIKFMNEDKESAKKEKATEAKKVAKKPSVKAKEVLEKKPELSKEEQIEAAKKLLGENGYSVNAKQTPKSYRRTGEY